MVGVVWQGRSPRQGRGSDAVVDDLVVVLDNSKNEEIHNF